ncbi:MAG: RelA/SpoT family protein [Patescibacteria group bacterium]
MATIKEITSLMQNPAPADIALITKAYVFAETVHASQRRITGEPYFDHLFETAKTLAELGMGAITISAGLLHDSIEDVNVTPETIEEKFGKEIRFLVEGVTKLGKLHYSGSERYIESLRKLCVAMSKDVRVLIIKLADRLHNMKSIEVLPKEKRDRISLETLEIYAPLAYRIGIRKINRELEDLAFPHVKPEEYEKVKKLLKTKSHEKVRHLEKFHKSIMSQLALAGMRNVKTSYRLKGLYSLYRKLLRKEWDIEKIYDISALRIIVPTVSDCYAVLGLIHSIWRPLPGRIKDYIALPKSNNYRGIHTTIFTGDGGILEVQIRTEEMHRKTEYGMHFEYKEIINNPKPNFGSISWVKKFFPSFILTNNEIKNEQQNPEKIVPSWIRELGEYNKEVAGTDNLVEDLKTDFFGDRVFTFTPKGDVIDLPLDSSTIDFAYAVHSDIGDHISGAKVNGKLVSIETILKNGDIVEVVTKQSSRPSLKWLEVAKTALAKKKIKDYLESEKK